MLYAYDKRSIEKYRIVAVFAFLGAVELSIDFLLLNVLAPNMETIIIGRIKIQAFHKPNSKAGINDNNLPPRNSITLKQY
jgi:hypothetical protein